MAGWEKVPVGWRTGGLGQAQSVYIPSRFYAVHPLALCLLMQKGKKIFLPDRGDIRAFEVKFEVEVIANTATSALDDHLDLQPGQDRRRTVNKPGNVSKVAGV